MTAPAEAQRYPSRPIRMIVPYPPGGSLDITMRVVAPKMSEIIGQNVIIDSRPGADGNIGTEIVARAPADGYTVLIHAVPLVVNPSLRRKLPFDVNKDFVPVSLLTASPLVLVVNPSLPAKSVMELVALGKAHPGKLTYASAGNGSNPIPSDKEHRDLDESEALVFLRDDSRGAPTISDGLWISVDLEGVPDSPVVGCKAKRHTPLIDLSRVNYYDPAEFWDPIPRPKGRKLVLDPDDFYILVSKEKIRIPPNYAAAMVAYDPSVGEFRIHYAGLFDPGFGYGSDDISGTRAVLEVRTHEVPFFFQDGQTVGRLVYERLLAKPAKIYGTGIGSSYQAQGLALSKQFKRIDPAKWALQADAA
jgi:deoxycytidine triphosphate deaminase